MATKPSILLALAFTCCFWSYFTESRKELRTKEMNQDNIIQLGRALPSNTIDPSRVTELSWRPRVFLYNGFLSNDECEHLISLGNEDNDKSGGNNSAKVVEQTTKLEVSLNIEAEHKSLYLQQQQQYPITGGDEITTRIEERISAWTFLPRGNGKRLRVLHSGPEETEKNHNYLGNTSMWVTGESVLATVVMYLSNVTQGGQIFFPEAESGNSRPKNRIWSGCTKTNQILKPIKGNAILFFNLLPNASLDPSSSHARCPITEGDMWWATKIVTVKSVTRSNKIASETGDDDVCTDEDDNCPQWASVGECERNPIFMVGTADYYGTCRKSCNVC